MDDLGETVTMANATDTNLPKFKCACHPRFSCNHDSDFCLTDTTCYAAIQKSFENGEELRTMGCFADKYRSKLMCKMAAAPTVAVLCCDTEFCNTHLQPQYAPPTAVRQPGNEPTIQYTSAAPVCTTHSCQATR
ncbi:hypothetical protein LSAT2_025953 [Lamellibrachia satsuma]|nr:hypothetical protein LSAT2_025953 [Lamellibrachia satsuma]